MENKSTTRPRILVTRAEDVVGEHWDDYADCVRRAGGEPVAADLGEFDDGEALPAFDGLLITAGVDVDPARYGQERSDRVREVDPARDRFEEALLDEAMRRDRPVFAICRGMQLVNVARGGSLLQHLEEREPHRARRGEDGVSIESGWHEVSVAPGSLLERIVGVEALRVNSRHHQAVLPEGVAPGLQPMATAPDGVIEALEDPARPWFLGVQWHPERPEMTDHPQFARGSVRLFEAFVEACRASSPAPAAPRPARRGPDGA